MKTCRWSLGLTATVLLLPILANAATVAQARSSAVAAPAAKAPTAIEREFRFVVNVEAEQDWEKNDPEYPGRQWSKATSKQRYEVTTRLRSDGALEVRNLLDPNLDARLEAKTIGLARQAMKDFAARGQPFKAPKTDAEMQAFNRGIQAETFKCKGDAVCLQETNLRYAAILAAMQYPEALEPDTEPGRYQYFTAYKGCPEKSRITLELQIDGVRYNKTSDKFVKFSERHQADTVDASDGLPLCRHYTAVIDTQDAAKPMQQENVFVPRPEGITEFTENGHTSRTPEPQPIPGAVMEWMDRTLRHAASSGKASAVLPLTLSLNGNSTWLGLWVGKAKVDMEWSFDVVPPTPTAPIKK